MFIALALALAFVLVVIVVWRRYVEELLQVAALIGALMFMIWLQDSGYLDGQGRNAAIDRPAPPATQQR